MIMLEKQGDSTEFDDHTNGSADEADDDSGSGGTYVYICDRECRKDFHPPDIFNQPNIS